MIIRRTLAHGTKYGIGVFYLSETENKKAVGLYVNPENDKNTLNFVKNKRVCYPSFN